MINDLVVQYWNDEAERNAYNAAFYELGFRWHWDNDTYCQLLGQCTDATERVSHYLKTRQPHLLTAYDAAFLVEIIQQKKAEHSKKCGAAAGAAAPGYFNWADTRGCELGA